MTYAELKALIDAKKKVQVTTPAAGTNTGNGTSSVPTLLEAAVAELWTIVCTTLGGADVAKFSVTGGVSGLQVNELTSDCGYTTDDGLVSFLLTAGGVAWATSDEFTFTVSQDGLGLIGATKIRCLEFVRHSKSDNVVVGYDSVKDEIRVIQKT